MPSGAVGYFKGNVYEALNEAAERNKLLLVEFYADWNYKSKWMNTNILGDSVVSAALARDFIVVQIPTTTPGGAELADMYKLTDYPYIVIFDGRGEPVDKLDYTLGKQDFLSHIQQVMMTVDGTAAWKLSAIFRASETGNKELADRLALEYLASNSTKDILDNNNHWRLFTDNYITYYGSSAFEFMMSHLGQFRKAIGDTEVIPRVEELFIDAIMPYAMGNIEYDSVKIVRLRADIKDTDIHSREMLLQLLSLADLRKESDTPGYINMVTTLADKAPENIVAHLLLSLEGVAGEATKEERQKAVRLVNRYRTYFNIPSQRAAIESLHSKLQGTYQTD